MYRILQKEILTPTTLRMVIEAPLVARSAAPGQFVILRVVDGGERIPLTIVDFDRTAGSVTIIFQIVGATTELLSTLEEGQCLAGFAGPLGNATELTDKNRVLCIGGGVGTAVVFPVIKALKKLGSQVEVIIGARNEEALILEEEIEGLADRFWVTTDDGSKGLKGRVTDLLKQLLDEGESYDEVIVIGPLIMMKFVCEVTRPYKVKTRVSMNPIMVDGTGMCGGCRVTCGGEVRYACVDGLEFDGHLIDFDEVMNRSKTYEKTDSAAHTCKGGLHVHG